MLTTTENLLDFKWTTERHGRHARTTWDTTSQCLIVAQKVASQMASEKWKKVHQKCEKWSILVNFWKLEACGQSNSVTRQVNFNWTKIIGKFDNSNATFWLLSHFYTKIVSVFLKSWHHTFILNGKGLFFIESEQWTVYNCTSLSSVSWFPGTTRTRSISSSWPGLSGLNLNEGIKSIPLASLRSWLGKVLTDLGQELPQIKLGSWDWRGESHVYGQNDQKYLLKNDLNKNKQ